MAERVVKVSLQAQVTQYLAGMEKARKATADTGTAAEKAAKQSEAQAKAMDAAGKGLMAVGLVAVAATALSVKAAIGWESAWAGVTKTVEGTPAELSKVEEGLRSLAKTLPASHDQIAAVAEAAGQLGIKTGSVVAFTRTMIDLGETTNLSAEEAATSLARFMNVMGTSQDDVSRLGSAVVALGNNYATTEAEIVEMGMRLSGAGRQIGLSEGQVLGLATALSSVGIEAEAGGSAISKVMIDIAAEVANGGEKLELFAETAGMSAKDFSAQWKTDPGAALAGFVEGLANAEAQGGSTLGILEELGITEVRMRDALLRSASASDQFTKAMKDGDQAFEDNNALAEEAAKRYATVESQLQIMGNRVTDAAISFGQVFLPAVSAAATAVGDVADALGSMDPVLQGTVASVALVGGAVALAGGVFLLAIPKIAAYQLALVTLSTSSMPAVAAAATGMMSATTRAGTAMAASAKFLTGPWGIALVAASAAVLLLTNHLESLKQTAEEGQNSLKNSSSALELLSNSAKGMDVAWLSDLDLSVKNVKGSLESAANSSVNFFDAMSQTNQQKQTLDVLKKTGESLGVLASTDLPGAQKSWRMLTEEYDLNAQAQWQLLSNMPEYKEALTAVANAQDINVTSTDEAANKTNYLKLAFGNAAPEALTAAEAYLAAADEASVLTDQITELMDKINESNNIGQDAVSTNAAYQESLAGIGVEVAAQRAAYEELHGTLDGFTLSLDESTVSGSANADMLAGVAGQAQAAALAQFEVDKKTMSAKDATDKYMTTLGLSRDALAATATANGYNADQVQNLINKVFALPTQAEVDIVVETAVAEARLLRIQRLIDGIGATMGNHVARGLGGAGGLVEGAADGGVFDYYAHGGLRENHVAQIAPAGAWRVWAEPETGGESYIPLALSKRQRSLEIWEETGHRLGVAGYANGYVTPVQYAPQGPSWSGMAPSTSRSEKNINITVPAIQNPDPRVSATIIGRQIARELAG